MSANHLHHAWQVGDVAVTAIHEQELHPTTGAWLMPELTAEQLDDSPDLVPDYVTDAGTLRLDSHSYALRIDGRTVIVDTGVGNGKTRDNPAWNDLRTDYLANLAAAGIDRGDVDLVIITHLHADHVGWNTTWDGSAWVPTFPQARYVVASTEWRYWHGVELEPARAAMFADSVAPVAEAGLVELVDVPAGGLQLTGGLTLTPAPGHTPGQVIVGIDSGGERAVITGDAIHHPIQIRRPEVTTRADIDPALTVATRRELIARLAENRSLVLGTHFAGGSAGRIDAVGDGFGFSPLGR